MPQSLFEFAGLTAFTKNFRRFQFELLKRMGPVIEEVATDFYVPLIQEALDEQGITWRGDLKEAIKAKAKRDRSGVSLRIFADEKTAPYADYIEHGRKPEKVSSREAHNIYEWVIEKLGVSPEYAAIVTLRVINKIETRGLQDNNTLPNPFLIPTVEQNKDEFLDRVQKRLDIEVGKLTNGLPS